MSPPSIKLAIASRMRDVKLVGAAINRIARDCGFDEKRAFEAEVAVVEAVNNAIEHGYKSNSDKEVEVTIECGADEIVFRVTDSGHPIPQDTLTRSKDAEFSSAADRGRGLLMMRAFTDDLQYESREGRNTLTLKKVLGSKNAGEEADSLAANDSGSASAEATAASPTRPTPERVKSRTRVADK